MSGACDNFILEDQSCEWFELVQYVESFDMGINFLEGPPGPPGPAGEAIFIPSVSEDGWISWTNTAGLPNPDPVYIKGPPGGGGSGDYDDLTDKPSINGVTLSGNGLGNVANERQYSAQNPPPYPVTSVAGKTGAVDLLPSDVGLGNVANERQYSSQNPPPYPVTSVDGKAGAVSVLPIGGTAGDGLRRRVGRRERRRIQRLRGSDEQAVDQRRHARRKQDRRGSRSGGGDRCSHGLRDPSRRLVRFLQSRRPHRRPRAQPLELFHKRRERSAGEADVDNLCGLLHDHEQRRHDV